MPSMSMTPHMGMQITPALLNLTRLLALPSMSLYQAVQQELMENPALEEVEAHEVACPRCRIPAVNGGCLCDGERAMPDWRAGERANESDVLQAVAAPSTLLDSLLADLYASLPSSEHPLALAVLGNLDERGLLIETAAEIAGALGVAEERVARIVQLVRELGPCGIATGNTRDRLLAQLDALLAEGISFPHVRAVIAEHLDNLGARRDRHIARCLGITVADITAVRQFIQRHLWPYPAQAALSCPAEPDQRPYRTPDLVIGERDGAVKVELVHPATHLLRLNPLYQQLARRSISLSEAEHGHVQEYLHRAATFLANLRQRETTLQRVGEAIIVRQQRFLRDGVRHLVPMTRLDIAAVVGMHESTVSRAVADKTALLPNGTLWPLSAFFAPALRVHDVLHEMVINEPEPRSDQQLARLLTERGYQVARRTVAKYREQMHIPPCQLR
jgi:RNA polymerase sigma-54 factor